MKNKPFFAGLLIVIVTIIFVVAGCATTGGNGTPLTPDKLAEQLAVDLNAIKAGSAMADGATVRLTGEVYLKTSLTVHEGVTLDLMADGAKFELQNGAELTVNGTLNSSGHGDHGNGWVEGGLRIGDGTAVINGSGTINLKSKGCLLNIGDKRHLTLAFHNKCSLVHSHTAATFLITGYDALVAHNRAAFHDKLAASTHLYQ
ncbi:hypothetical protein FACS1894106_5290 [Spirochaetia bacterium]|nr:hypothetical protein FACS1894106_5290 [Spirochaetia bacterium]